MKLSTTTYLNLVKARRKTLISVVLIVAALSSLHFSKAEKKPAEKIKDIYTSNFIVQQQRLNDLGAALQNGKELKDIKELFLQCRLTYKKTAYLVEYFNPYETRMLNGPALKRTEEDNPQTIVEPQGFQVLEEKIFGDWSTTSRTEAIEQVKKLTVTFQRLQDEPDLVYKFHDDVIFGALRTSLVRLASMGISGFDSPIANYSLPEAIATVESIFTGLLQYKSSITKKNKTLFTKLTTQAELAKRFLTASKSFEKFDRLVFLKNHLDPLFSTVTEIRDALSLSTSGGLLPVNQQAKSIFDINFFNPDFFSPNERYRMTPDRIALGKRLFFDPVLSGNGNRSCGTCHKPNLAFTDAVATPLDIDEKTSLSRNTPTLWNSIFQTRQFFDSRTTTLENQLSDVVHNSKEMKGSLQNTIPVLKNDPVYAALFKQAYVKEKDQITQYNIANAIASYIRSLVAMNSRFDQYMRGDEKKMNDQEKKGFNLFMGKGKCATCHYIPLFNGLVPPDFNETESEVLGVPQTKDTINAKLDPDLGKYNFTRSDVHRHSFKTPTLRNIELTAPYMHNGVYTTLEEVIDFYNKGGGAGLHIAPEYQTLPADKLNLTKKEISDIVAFMKTLTDSSSIKKY